MPSIWCPKCQYHKRREEKCEKCGFIEEDKSKTYSVPKAKKAKIINIKNDKKIKFDINKNSLMIIPIILITVSIAYMAFSKYRERVELEKAFEYVTGTKDIEEYEKMNLKERQKALNKSKFNKDLNENTKYMMKEMKKQMNF